MPNCSNPAISPLLLIESPRIRDEMRREGVPRVLLSSLPGLEKCGRASRLESRNALNRGNDLADWGKSVIRQAISCDICGNEKRQTNHWFVAFDQGGELRVAAWSSRNRLRPGSKHLCGQTCLHKLVDEFMAKAISGRGQAGADELDMSERVGEPIADRALGRSAAGGAGREAAPDSYVAAGPLYEDGESSARLVMPRAPAAPAGPRALPFRAHPGLVPPTAHPQSSTESPLPSPSSDTAGSPAAAADPVPRISSRQWRAEAWNRERSRELRNGNTDVNIKRRSGS